MCQSPILETSLSIAREILEDNKMWQIKRTGSWAHKVATRSLLLAGTTALLVPLVLVPAARAQITIGIGVNPPVCSYGYYNYAPYGCAPSGFYGPGYFYNGIFLGVGPWANWGYGHGWGGHRFNGARGGRYVAGRGYGGQRAHAANRGRGRSAARVSRSHGASHAARARGSASPHGSASHGGGSHGGGEHH